MNESISYVWQSASSRDEPPNYLWAINKWWVVVGMFLMIRLRRQIGRENILMILIQNGKAGFDHECLI